ncbi:MAG: DMT family transporter [Alphaproteobacteria bacterium]|nr:DMT family transporter [Alphaproteobacteria bacterium]MBU1756878.1 DMT family transporter [Alphaproteobacteria bacterium]MBU2033088.1 DMT family transporter [Alphaproteobacteria bacterium]
MIQSRILLPIGAALLGVACLSLMDAFMKGAALAAGTYSATLLRSAIGTLIAAPVWLLLGGRWPRWPVLKLHLERGVVSAFMALSFFYSLTKLAIAEAIAISFVAPLLALYLARVLLGETIRREAVLASVLGFAGTLVIVGGKLGDGGFDRDTALGLAAILVSALLYAYNFIVIRRQSQAAGPLEIAAFHSGVAAAVMALVAPFLFVWPGEAVLLDTALAAALTVAGAMAIAWAYARAEAQVLVPMEYSGFLWAALFGWLFFREGVTLPTLAGTAIIVAACWLAARNRHAERTAGAVLPATEQRAL